MILKRDDYALPVSDSMWQLIEDVSKKSNGNISNGFVVSFRDTSYSVERGGYHPVEMALDHDGHLLYITDFSYVGIEPYAELSKELDFDFSMGLFQHLDVDYPIKEGVEIYSIWEGSFLSYHSMGVYQVMVKEF